jgi:hypothetical protein
MQSRVSITLCHMCRLSPATTLMSALIAALCWNKDVLCRIRTGWGYDWLASSSERSSKFWRCISQQYSGVFCLRGYANWIHHKAWCGTTNANFVIKLSKQPKQHQIQRLIIPVLPFFPSDGTHCLTVRDICGHSTVYTVRQTQNSNEEQPWNRTAGRGDYHLKRLPIDQALQRLESRAAIHRIRRSRLAGAMEQGRPDLLAPPLQRTQSIRTVLTAQDTRDSNSIPGRGTRLRWVNAAIKTLTATAGLMRRWWTGFWSGELWALAV